MQNAKRVVKRLLGMPLDSDPYTEEEVKRFREIKVKSHGMLTPGAYRALYEVAQAAPDLDLVEVGAASGASSICLALGMIDSNKSSKLITVEKLEGGSRIEVGDYDANYNLLTSNMQAFNVLDQVRLFPHYLTVENAPQMKELIKTDQIGALVHDADGRIDRDFYLFWELLPDNAAIVIDDCEDIPQFREQSERYPDGGTKMLTTYRLTQLFIEWGLFKLDRMIRGTAFGHKPAGADFSKMDMDTCQAIVDKIMEEREAYMANNPQ